MEQTRLVNCADPQPGAVMWEKANPESVKYGATELNGLDNGATLRNTEKQEPASACWVFLRKLVRKKVFTEDSIQQTDLHRCLSTFDLVNLGIGSCICNGIYVVVGEVAKDVAGPAVLLSFLVAGLASAFAALCYAEFAARVPRSGSAYVYSYVTVGELMAFVIGWNLLLEYIIGTASSARAWSMYFNSLIDDSIKDAFREAMPMNVPGFSHYPDFFSLGITLLMTILLAVGVRESMHFNNIFTGVNIFVIVYVVICGLFKANLHNWQLPQSQVPEEGAGTGGFLPYGLSGMMSGAATCFYAYVGFDCIATTGEETKNPEKTIPIAVVCSMLIILVSYCSVAAVITLMCPYYLINVNTPVPFVFHYVGWDVARYIIAIGAMCGLSTSLLGSMFPMPRVLYAMGSDGLVFRFLAEISPRFKTPLIGTVTSGVFAGILAMVFSLKELIEMMSIGTLLAYTLVAICVLILRYETEDNMPKTVKGRTRMEVTGDDAPIKLRYLLFPPTTTNPSTVTAAVAKTCVAALCLSITGLCALLSLGAHELMKAESWAIFLALTLTALILTFLFCITRQPQSHVQLNFQVPFVPYIPAFSCLVNTYLMFKLDVLTWIRFGVWMAVGFSIYFLYGINNATMSTWYSTSGAQEGGDDVTGSGACCGSKDGKATGSGDNSNDVDRYDSLGETTP